MRKFLATLLALVMTLALMVPASWGENKETYQLPDSLEGKTVILHTNDVHGAIDKYAKVAALRDECYDKGAHQVILLDAGDFSQGSPYVSLSKGATALDMMALVGYDVITLGNHEFDYGFPQLMENLKKHQGDFMVACNNLVDDEGELLFAPGGTAPIYADDTYETELFRIAIVGMATPETQTKANPALMKGLSFIGGKDLYKVTQEDVDMARSEGNADIVIALGHLGVDKSSEPNCSYNVMQNVKGIDLNAAASRELVAELLFRAIAEASTVTYTPDFGYVTDKVLKLDKSTLGYKNFKLEGKADADSFGRPATKWTYNVGDKSTLVVAKADASYTTKVDECDIAKDLGITSSKKIEAAYIDGKSTTVTDPTVTRCYRPQEHHLSGWRSGPSDRGL